MSDKAKFPESLWAEFSLVANPHTNQTKFADLPAQIRNAWVGLVDYLYGDADEEIFVFDTFEEAAEDIFEHMNPEGSWRATHKREQAAFLAVARFAQQEGLIEIEPS
jgi:hypothetical protein